jgi:thioredoxin-related protein
MKLPCEAGNIPQPNSGRKGNGMGPTRREIVLGAAALGLLAARSARAQAVLTDDGLYRQPWFLESFLDLAEDLEGARRAGKRFAIIWELRGCPYCRQTHLVNFARPDIAAYVQANFDILQLNLVGARPVTDFDGAKLPEKQFAAKYGVRYTPTLQFFPESAEGLASLSPEQREVARAQGYQQPDDFLAMFRFVREKAYENQTFWEYVKARR